MKSIFVLILSLLSINVFAQNNLSGKHKSYNVKSKKPGTILSYLPMNELESIDSLTIIGFLYDTDLNIIRKCKNLSYLDLGRSFVIYSPETLKSEEDRIGSINAVLALSGTLASAQSKRNDNALEYAYAKGITQLAKGKVAIKSGDKNCIVPAEFMSNMQYLKTIILPYKALHIGRNVLSNCPLLETVEFPLYLETIRNDSFQHCPKLKNLKFPNALNYIGENSFEDCDALEIVDLSKCFFNKGYNKYGVWESAFRDCDNLKELHLPQGVKKNNGWGYEYINGNRNNHRPYPIKVYIPANWEHFGSLNKWGNCELHFKSPTAPGYFGWAHDYASVTLYCPKGSTTSYYKAVGEKIDNVKIIEE